MSAHELVREELQPDLTISPKTTNPWQQRMSEHLKKPTEGKHLFQAIRKSDCGIVLFATATAANPIENYLLDQAGLKVVEVLRLMENVAEPWRNENLTSFLNHSAFHQAAMVGNLIAPSVISSCLFALEEGFQVFCIDTEMLDPTPERATTLLRLSQAGVIPLTRDQFFAELSY